MILNLKNARIEEIVEENVDYRVFEGTFCDDGMEERTDFTFILEDKRVIKIKSYLESYYGSSKGMVAGAEYAKMVLEHLANGTYEDMTIGGFIEEFVVKYIKTAAILCVDDKEYLLVDERIGLADYVVREHFGVRGKFEPRPLNEETKDKEVLVYEKLSSDVIQSMTIKQLLDL